MTRTCKIFLFVALAGVALSQYAPTNYQTSDSGRQESVDQNGNIQGQYSYLDPNGKTITVKYTAGKDGFQVQGDHLPVAPQAYPSQGYQPQSFESQSYQQPQRYQAQSYQEHQQGYQGQNYQQNQQSYQGQSYQSYQPQGYNFQSAQAYQPNSQGPVPKNLFTPAQSPFPAATAGQIKNYQDALKEEEEEAQKEANSLGQNDHRFGAPIGSPEGIPQTPYNIQFGADNGFSFEYSL